MSIICPAGCGKKFTTEHFVKRHLEVMHKDDPAKVVKRKGWATPYGFVDMKEPVTYQEACETSKVIADMLAARQAAKSTKIHDQQCTVCGSGTYLPSGVCDHCNTTRDYAITQSKVEP